MSSVYLEVRVVRERGERREIPKALRRCDDLPKKHPAEQDEAGIARSAQHLSRAKEMNVLFGYGQDSEKMTRG